MQCDFCKQKLVVRYDTLTQNIFTPKCLNHNGCVIMYDSLCYSFVTHKYIIRCVPTMKKIYIYSNLINTAFLILELNENFSFKPEEINNQIDRLIKLQVFL